MQKRPLRCPRNLLSALLSLLFVGPVAARTEIDSLKFGPTLSIEKVVVTTSRHASDPRLATLSPTLVNRQKIDQSLRPSLLPTLTEQVPGLFTTARGMMGYGVSTGAAGGMSVRGIGGAPTTGVLVVIDGQPQYSGLMGHPIADGYQSHSAEQVEVVRGPASVLYGSNAMGGVIHIATTRRHTEGGSLHLRAGYGSYNTLESALRGELRKGRFTLALSGLYNTSEGHRPNMDFEQYGGTLNLGYALTQTWKIALSGEIFHFNASNPGTVSAPLIDNDSRITRGRTALSLSHRYAKISGNLTLFCNLGKHRINDGYHLGEEPLDYRFRSKDQLWGASLYETWQIAPQSRLTIGADLFGFGGEAWNHFPDENRNEPITDKTAYESAVYADWQQALTRWLDLNFGLRLDHHSHAGTEWIPALSLTSQLGHGSQLRASLSKGFRFPTLREMYLFPPQNPDLKAERLWNYEVAFSHRIQRLRYGVNLFYIDGKNKIQTLLVNGRPHNENTGKIENWGVEGEFSLSIGRAWSLGANYSFLHMRYPVLAAPEHKLYGSIAFSRGRWNLETGVQYVAGLYTELATAKSDATKEDFLLWNLRGSFRVMKILSLWVRGENLLGAKYELNAGFPMPGATVMAGVEIGF